MAPATERGDSVTLTPVRVLYVAGLGRSGSTLLDRLLGQAPGCVSVGELVRFWQRGLQRGVACSCGQPVDRCELWGPAGRQAFGGWQRLDADEVVALQASVDRVRHLPRMLVPALDRDHAERRRRYTELHRRLYAAVRDVAGAHVVVDSSKDVSTVFLLARTPGIDLRVVHLVRDARGVAYSWTKSVRKPDAVAGDEYMDRYRPGSMALRYVAENLLLGGSRMAGAPRLLVRYEDLVADPGPVLRRVLRFAGAPDGPLNHVDGHAVVLRPGHSLGGNPLRFRHGRTELRPDEGWRTELPAAQRRLVTAVTGPLMATYAVAARVRGRAGE